jgi:hypothetical protein
MPHIAGHARSQTLLLPETVDDYVGPDNAVRFIDAFVEGLDLTSAGFACVTRRRRSSTTGADTIRKSGELFRDLLSSTREDHPRHHSELALGEGRGF